MEESHLPQTNDQHYLTQGIKFRSTAPDRIPFNFIRQRSISSLQKKQRTPSPHTRNFKQKHLMYKKDLLQQKFQNLQLHAKQDKRPLKLKLQRANKQNIIVLKQLSDISNEIQIKFQAQNCLVKKSLQKMEKLISKSIPNPNRLLQRTGSLNKINYHQKLPLIVGPSQNEKNLKIQLQKALLQKAKLQQQLRSIKSVNGFLSNENYKLSMQNSMFKARIMQYEQDDYDNALKTVNDLSQRSDGKQEYRQRQQNQSAMSEQQSKQRQRLQKISKIQINLQRHQEDNIQDNDNNIDKNRRNIDQDNISKNNQNLLMKQIQTQHFQFDQNINNNNINSPKNNKCVSWNNNTKQNNIQSSNQSLSQQRIIRKQSKEINDINNEVNNNKDKNKIDNKNKINMNNNYDKVINEMDDSVGYELVKLSKRIKQLQQQLQQQKLINDSLSNKIALLKLKLYQSQNKQIIHKSLQQKVQSAISIKMQINQFNQQKLNQYQYQQHKYQDQQHQYQDQQQQQLSQQQSQVQNHNYNNDKQNRKISNKINKQKTSHNIDSIKQSLNRNLQPQPKNYSSMATKSKILSNQIIYFAQPIQQQNHNHPNKFRNSQNLYHQNNNKFIKSSSNNIQNGVKFQNNINYQSQNYSNNKLQDSNSNQKKKTLCLKKLQIPAAQIQKRRKSITQKINSSILNNKGLNLNNSLSFYSNQKVAQLEIIRQSISLKFEAFKYTFQLFQNQMILWPSGKLNIKQLKSILSEYPFFLDQNSIELILNYCNITQGKQIKVDIFCNKLKQFIGEYEQMTEQQELILQKKIFKRWKYTKEQILETMRRNESCEGQITKSKFFAVLQEFKFEDKQIHHLLSQSVAISSDMNHIKYKKYLDNFLTKK